MDDLVHTYLPRVVSYATITRDGWVNNTLPVTRALFDSGATANFISTSWAQRYAPHLVFERCDTYVLLGDVTGIAYRYSYIEL